LLTYSIVFIHELGHFIAARLLNIEIKRIEIMPFGIALKLKEQYINCPKKEIIVALAGPSMNLLMILVAYILKTYCLFKADNLSFFIMLNFILVIFNMMPVLPLDGGNVLKSILIMKNGYSKALKQSLKITKIFAVAILIMGIIVVFYTKYNISVIIISIFLISYLKKIESINLFIIMKEFTKYKQKLLEAKILKVQVIVVMEDVCATKIISYFSYNQYYLINIVDSKMNFLGTITETQLLDAILTLNSNSNVLEILKLYQKI